MQVREVMSRKVLVASPDDTVKKAATMMAQVNCGALPVGENDRLVGMVTDRDITLRAVAKGNPPDHCTVREGRRNLEWLVGSLFQREHRNKCSGIDCG